MAGQAACYNLTAQGGEGRPPKDVVAVKGAIIWRGERRTIGG